VTPRDHAQAIYLTGIRDGRLDEAMAQHTGARYTQHSTGVKDGQAGFKEFFSEFLERHPERDIRIVRALQDGPNVFLHAYQNLGNGQAEWVTADFFDRDSEGRIGEHWDVIAPYNRFNPSCRSNIDGATEIKDHHRTARNKAHVRDFIETCLIDRRIDLLSDYVDPVAFSQHSPLVGDGLDAFLKEYDPTHHKLSYQECFMMVGEGNFVATLNRAKWDEQDLCQCDLFRLEDGMIVEHWETAEPVPPRDEWVNTGKF